MILSLFYTLKNKLDTNEWHITDIIPTYTTLAVYFSVHSPLFKDPAALNAHLQKALQTPYSFSGSNYEIDVCYTGADVDYVCRELSLSKKDLIALHANRPYPIAMLGFRPYFPYLLGLDKKLHLPRRKSPRKKVQKGSVAIGGLQTGIYSEDSPGGWHIIGVTDFDDFSSLQPGDTIMFKAKEKLC